MDTVLRLDGRVLRKIGHFLPLNATALWTAYHFEDSDEYVVFSPIGIGTHITGLQVASGVDPFTTRFRSWLRHGVFDDDPDLFARAVVERDPNCLACVVVSQ